MTQNSPPGHRTLREILSQPETWRETSRRLSADGTLDRLKRAFSADRPWLFVGCGSSYYLSQLVASLWGRHLHIRASAVTASDLLFSPEETLWRAGADQMVLISRSGETTEVLRAAELLKSPAPPRTLSVTCNGQTPLAALCTHTLALPWADEESMVGTRSLTSMLVAFQRLGLAFAGDPGMEAALDALPDRGRAFLQASAGRIQRFAEERRFTDFIFMGQGPRYWLAQESALKVMEMSSSYAQAYHTLEVRHGPRAIADRDTLITLLASEASLDEEIRVLAELRRAGAATCLVARRATEAARESSDLLIELGDDQPEPAQHAMSAVVAQLLGVTIGIRKGLDPDRPHNLTRAVVLDR